MIVYTSICRAKDAVILAELSEDDLKGNASQVVAMLMQHLRDNPGYINEGDRRTFVQKNEAEYDFFSNFIESCASAMGDNIADEHYFHLYMREGVIYCCLSDDPEVRDQKVSFAYLDFVHGEFTKTYGPGRIGRANAYAFDKNFRPNLRSAMHYHNTNHLSLSREKRVQDMLAKVQDLKSVVGRNISVVLQRTDDLEAMIVRTDDMKKEATVFKKKARVNTRRMRRKWWRQGLVIGIVVLAFIYLGSVKVCGWKYQYCHIDSPVEGQGDDNGEDNQQNNGNANGNGQN